MVTAASSLRSAAPPAPGLAAATLHAASTPSPDARRSFPSADSVPALCPALRKRPTSHAVLASPPGSNVSPTGPAPWLPRSASAGRPALPGSPPPTAWPHDSDLCPGRRRPATWPDESVDFCPGPFAPPMHSCVTPFRSESLTQIPQAFVQGRGARSRWLGLGGLCPQAVHFSHGAHWRRQRAFASRRQQVYFLPFAFGPLQNHTLPFGMDAERLAAHLTGQVKRRLGHSVPRQLQGVGRHPRLQRAPHFRGRSKKAIGRHQSVYPLIRPLEVVMVDEQANPPLRIAQIHEHRAFDTLPPQGAPETLDFAQGLRPPWRRHHLLDSALLQLLGEYTLAAPGHVLRAVIGQDLLRRAVRSQ